MNTTTINETPGGARCLKLLSGVFAAGLLLGATGCSTTLHVSQDIEKSKAGFLTDYSLLQRGSGKQANYVYIDPAVPWKNYTQIWVKPTQLWAADDPNSKLGKLSKDEQQLLVDYMTTSLVDSLEKSFKMVDHGGPGVLVIRVAITDARKSKPVLNLATTVYPAALALSYGKQIVSGTATGVGVTYVEGEITDGETGKILVECMDARAGTKALRTKFDGTWGDYKLACDWWAHRLVLRLVLAQQGDLSTDRL